MNSLTNITDNLIKAIGNNMPKGGFLTLEVGVALNGIKTITASVTSGNYSRKIVYFSVTGVITDGYHDITKYSKRENINAEALAAFRELMFNINTRLSHQELTSATYKNGIMAFNAIIKPWSVEVSHIEGAEIIRVARMKDCDNMLISGTNGSDHGSFKIGEAKTAMQGAYELITDCLSMSATKQYIRESVRISEPLTA